MGDEPRYDDQALEALVLAVFRKDDNRTGEKGGVDEGAVRNFARREEVIEAAKRFRREVLALWNQITSVKTSLMPVADGSSQSAPTSKGSSAEPLPAKDTQLADDRSRVMPVREGGSHPERWQPPVLSDFADGVSSDGNLSSVDAAASSLTALSGLAPESAPRPSTDSPDSEKARAVAGGPKALSSPATIASNDAPASSSPSPPSGEGLSNVAIEDLVPVPMASPSQPSGSAIINPAATPGSVPAVAGPPAAPVEPKVFFNVPNAKVGEAYRAKIEGKSAAGHAVKVKSARTEATGLAFDEHTGELHGTPSQAGEFQVNLQWREEGGASRSSECTLVVTANPKDLWKDIAPDPDDPYFKTNEDSTYREVAGFRIAAASKRGRSHAHNGTFRDDDFFVDHCASSGWSVLIVADGAGSARSSRKGSEIAVRKAGEHIVSELSADKGAELVSAVEAWEAEPSKGGKPLKDSLYYLLAKAAHSAVFAIDEEAQAKAAVFKDYSTTLLAAIHRKISSGVFVASFWLGDGAIGAYGGKAGIRLMGSPDSGEFAGQTRFLDKAAVHNAQDLWSRIVFDKFDALTALILMTDGISDPRFETDSGLLDAKKWDALWGEIAPILRESEPDKRLVEWLDFFTPGHHDDRTIALLW